MKITQVQVDNLLGVSSVNVRIQTPVVLFCGPNAAGKSSLQEAIRMAITRDEIRDVKLKKEYGKLVHDGSKAGGACVYTEGSEAFAFNMPAGDFSGPEIPESMRIALHGQRFAEMTADERRSFLFGLTGCRATPDTVRSRLVDRQCDANKVEAVLPMLRTGFPSACDFAKTKATDAKGAWRAVTGETYGAKKAETWKAEKPTATTSDTETVKAALARYDDEIAQANQAAGAMAAKVRARAEATTRRAALQNKADSIPRIKENLELAQKELAEFEPKVVALRERAKGAVRTGLVHDMACSLADLIDEEQPLGTDRPPYQRALAVMERYEAEHGPLDAASTPDADAQASLPEHERGLTVLQNRVKNLQRDHDDAVAAKAQFDALEPTDDEQDAESELATTQANLKAAKVERDKLQAELRAIEDTQRKIAEADGKTKKAAEHHAEVLAWTAIADALAPDGIPGELLMEALAPINKTLTVAAIDTGWMRVTIEPDMRITAAGRDYNLLSESEQWRVDAMIAQTVAKVSGLKVLMLDRVDVLDIKGRVTLLEWLDTLADDGHIDTALLFATLKAMPSGLPANITPVWIENGAVVEYKVAA